MSAQGIRAAGAAILLVFGLYGLPALASAAAGEVLFTNDEDTALEALYCATSTGAAKKVSGPVAKAAKHTFKAGELGECERLIVRQNKDSAYQFYAKSKFADAQSITLELQPLSNASDKKQPVILVSAGEDDDSLAAGIPLRLLTEKMQFGLDKAGYQELALPKTGDADTPDTFAVAFADVSWIMPEVVYAELVEGKQLVSSVKLQAPFSNSVLFGIFDQLKETGAAPVHMDFKGKKTAFSGEEAWDKFQEAFGEVADGGDTKASILFGSADFHFTLELNLDASTAVLTVTRKSEAAFG